MKKILILFTTILMLGGISCSKDNKNSDEGKTDNGKTDNPYSLQDDKDVFLLPPVTIEKAFEFLKTKYNDVEYCVLKFEQQGCTGKMVINGKHSIEGIRMLIFKRGKKYPIALHDFTCTAREREIRIFEMNNGYHHEIDELLKGHTEKVVDGERVVYGYIDLTEY